MKTFLALDLEMNQPSRKIIQIGIVVGDLQSGNILERDSLYVDPGENISEYITALTGIDNDVIQDYGGNLAEKLSFIRLRQEQHSCEKAVVVWGAGDLELLYEQAGITKGGDHFLGHRYIDTKTLFQAYCLSNNLPRQGGLARSMARLGMRFEGRQHDAVDDAANTWRVFCHLLKKFRQ